MSPAIPGGGPPSPGPRLPWNSVARSSDAMRDTIIRCPSRNAPLPRAACQRAPKAGALATPARSEEHTSELQSRENLVCRLLLEKKKIIGCVDIHLLAVGSKRLEGHPCYLAGNQHAYCRKTLDREPKTARALGNFVSLRLHEPST